MNHKCIPSIRWTIKGCSINKLPPMLLKWITPISFLNLPCHKNCLVKNSLCISWNKVGCKVNYYLPLKHGRLDKSLVIWILEKLHRSTNKSSKQTQSKSMKILAIQLVDFLGTYDRAWANISIQTIKQYSWKRSTHWLTNKELPSSDCQKSPLNKLAQCHYTS